MAIWVLPCSWGQRSARGMQSAPLSNEMADGPEGGAAYWLGASDGVRIRAGLWRAGDKGTVFIFPGRTEYVEKYGRAATDLAARGYSTITIDWRCQGLADRLTPDRNLGHVGKFSDYQLDVAELVKLANSLDCPRPWYLIGHSMGGCIGLRALHQGLPVNAVAFTGPMWGVSIKPVLRPLAWGYSWLTKILRDGQSYAPGTFKTTYVLLEAFADNVLTTDADMYAYMVHHAREHPEIAIGGPSLRWLFEALVETRRLRGMKAPEIPALTYMSSDERVVDPRPVHQVMSRWPGGDLHMVENAEHEIMMETPAVRKEFFDKADAFFSTQRAAWAVESLPAADISVSR